MKMMLTSSLLMSPPVVWGKLPTHGDYISHNVQANQAQQWQQWLGIHAPEYIASTVQRQTPRESDSASNWTHLDVHHVKAVVQRLPVSFILPPGQLAFSRDGYVVGVLIASHDAIGRHHPMVIYSLASKQWLAKYWDQTSHASQDWQYWLGRWLLHVQQLAQQQQEPQTSSKLDVHSLLMQGVSSLWRMHEPKFLMRFTDASTNHLLPKESELALERVLKAHQLPAKLVFPIPSHSLKGVTHMPWIDWPERLLDKVKPAPAYWQQDSNGFYVTAAERLALFYKATSL
jgi:type VI secretion system protein ImpM